MLPPLSLRGVGYSCDTSAGYEVAREVKERLCFVAPDYREAVAGAGTATDLEVAYELPDGRTLMLGQERSCPPPRPALHTPALVAGLPLPHEK